MLAQRIETLFRKLAEREDGGPGSQRTILLELESRLLLYQKRKGEGGCCKFLVSEAFVLTSGQVRSQMFL